MLKRQRASESLRVWHIKILRFLKVVHWDWPLNVPKLVFSVHLFSTLPLIAFKFPLIPFIPAFLERNLSRLLHLTTDLIRCYRQFHPKSDALSNNPHFLLKLPKKTSKTNDTYRNEDIRRFLQKILPGRQFLHKLTIPTKNPTKIDKKLTKETKKLLFLGRFCRYFQHSQYYATENNPSSCGSSNIPLCKMRV